MLGVRTYDVNEKSVAIKPYIKGRKYAKGTVNSIAGEISVSWKKTGDVFEITVESANDRVKKYVTLPNGDEVVTTKKKATYKCNIK